MGTIRVEDWQRYALEHPSRTADEYTEAHRHTIIRGGASFYAGLYFHWEAAHAPLWISAACLLRNDNIVPVAALDAAAIQEIIWIGEALLTGVGRSGRKPTMLPEHKLGFRFARIPREEEIAIARGYLARLSPLGDLIQVGNMPEIKEWLNGTLQTQRRRSG